MKIHEKEQINQAFHFWDSIPKQAQLQIKATNKILTDWTTEL